MDMEPPFWVLDQLISIRDTNPNNGMTSEFSDWETNNYLDDNFVDIPSIRQFVERNFTSAKYGEMHHNGLPDSTCLATKFLRFKVSSQDKNEVESCAKKLHTFVTLYWDLKKTDYVFENLGSAANKITHLPKPRSLGNDIEENYHSYWLDYVNIAEQKALVGLVSGNFVDFDADDLCEDTSREDGILLKHDKFTINLQYTHVIIIDGLDQEGMVRLQSCFVECTNVPIVTILGNESELSEIVLIAKYIDIWRDRNALLTLNSKIEGGRLLEIAIKRWGHISRCKEDDRDKGLFKKIKETVEREKKIDTDQGIESYANGEIYEKVTKILHRLSVVTLHVGGY